MPFEKKSKKGRPKGTITTGCIYLTSEEKEAYHSDAVWEHRQNTLAVTAKPKAHPKTVKKTKKTQVNFLKQVHHHQESEGENQYTTNHSHQTQGARKSSKARKQFATKTKSRKQEHSLQKVCGINERTQQQNMVSTRTIHKVAIL